MIAKENRIRPDGGKTSNLYTLYDFKELWSTKNNTGANQIIEQEQEKKVIELLESMGYTITKEREPTSEPTKVTDVSTQNKQSLQEQNTTLMPKSQELERYTLDQIRQLFDYDIMIQDNPYKQQEIDSVMDTTYNYEYNQSNDPNCWRKQAKYGSNWKINEAKQRIYHLFYQ